MVGVLIHSSDSNLLNQLTKRFILVQRFSGPFCTLHRYASRGRAARRVRVKEY